MSEIQMIKAGQRKLEMVKKHQDQQLETIHNAHDQNKVDIKNVQKEEMVSLQDEHHHQLAQEAFKKEKLLGEMRENLTTTTAMTEKHLKSLKTNSAIETNQTKKKLSDEKQRLIDENGMHVEDLNDRFNGEIRQANQDGQNRMRDLKEHNHNEVSSTEKYHQTKIQSKNEEFRTRFYEDEKNNKNLKYQQDTHFKKERMATNQNQQYQLAKMTENHTSFIEKRETELRKGLKEQEGFFEKKYTGQIEKNNKDFKILEAKNKATVESLKTNLTKEITKTAVRNDDPFYKFETLKPRLKQFEDRVEIEVDIPDHSKQDVNLTINGKEAVVNFNRRYADASKGLDGSINKISKVETFTTRLATNHVLDPKSVKSSYDNGVMSYIIKKS